jgi:hypothetical protein
MSKAALILVVGPCLAICAIPSFASSTNADEVVAKHLDSIGTAQARSAIKSRAVEGAVKFRILSGGSGFAEGKSVLLSEGRKSVFFLSFAGGDYRGEHMIFNGDKTQVGFATQRQTRSNFGLFAFTYDVILRDNLLTGPLSSGWALEDLNDHKAKLSYKGQKNVDGQQVHAIQYSPKKYPDLTIMMYFDTETYHLVRTDYSLTVQAGLGKQGGPDLSPQQSVPGSPDTGPIVATGQSNETATARQYQTRYKLTEKYSDYKTADGLTLPNKYEIQFSQENPNGTTYLTDYELTAGAIKNNVTADERNFEVK